MIDDDKVRTVVKVFFFCKVARGIVVRMHLKFRMEVLQTFSCEAKKDIPVTIFFFKIYQ